MKAVIIAGGQGKRLRPLTYTLPKPVVPIVNKPFLIYQVELLKKHGIRDIILCLNYKAEDIKKVFGDGSKYGVKINYVLEEKPLGTAGAVKNAEQYFDKDPLIVFNGDILTDLDISALIKFHKDKKAKVTLTLTRVDDPSAYGLIITDDQARVERFLEKPSTQEAVANTINAGTYVLDPEVFKRVPKGEVHSFERELFPDLLEADELIVGYDSTAYWLDIGNIYKYKKAHHDILHKLIHVEINGDKKKENIYYAGTSQIDPKANIEGPCHIGSNCRIEDKVNIQGNVTIGDNVIIGENTTLENCIVWSDTRIGKNIVLRDCVVGNNCIIEDNVRVHGPAVVACNTSIIKYSAFGVH